MNELIAASYAVAIVVGISQLFVFIRKGYRNKRERKPYSIEIKHIKRVDDDDLNAALELYVERFKDDPDQMVGQDDIVRWLQEAKSPTQKERLREDFFVAKRNGHVVGGLYTTYYKKSQLLFVSYLFVKKGEQNTREGTIGLNLAKYLREFVRKEIKDCQGVLFEVAPEKSEENEPTAKNGRIRHFRAIAEQINFRARQVVINYLQPKLSLDDKTKKEKHLALLYVCLNGNISAESLPRSEVEKILHVIYDDLYGDYYLDNLSKNQNYRTYLNGLSSKIIAALPEQVPLS